MSFNEPGLGLRFQVVIDGYGNLGNWNKCEGLSVEYEIESYSEGGQNGFVHRLPGRAKYTNVKLTRYLDKTSAAVAGWVASIQGTPQRQTAQITALDAEGNQVTVWSLVDVLPVKWNGPSFDISSSNVATETLELIHNGFLGAR